MNYLIGDIGNTSLKICKINNKFRIVKTFLFRTRSVYLEKDLKKKINQLTKHDTCNKILFSSVVPNVYRKIDKIFRKKNFKIFEIKKFGLNKFLKFKVKRYSQLGSDRIANAIGAYYKFKTNCIVIDFGTATTFDVIKKPGMYDGGVITPGIALSIENLFSSTALLPTFKLKKYPTNYGKNTKEALNSGFFWGYQGLFKNKIFKQAIIENDITIQGILKVYRKFLI